MRELLKRLPLMACSLGANDLFVMLINIAALRKTECRAEKFSVPEGTVEMSKSGRLFGGDATAFLQEEVYFWGDIGAALTQQLAQLSPLERQGLQQLAQAEQPLPRQTLWATLTPLPTKSAYFYALQNLQRAFLLRQTDVQVELPALLVAYLARHAGTGD